VHEYFICFDKDDLCLYDWSQYLHLNVLLSWLISTNFGLTSANFGLTSANFIETFPLCLLVLNDYYNYSLIVWKNYNIHKYT